MGVFRRRAEFGHRMVPAARVSVQLRVRCKPSSGLGSWNLLEAAFPPHPLQSYLTNASAYPRLDMRIVGLTKKPSGFTIQDSLYKSRILWHSSGMVNDERTSWHLTMYFVDSQTLHFRSPKLTDNSLVVMGRSAVLLCRGPSVDNPAPCNKATEGGDESSPRHAGLWTDAHN